jgi:hypothetical protein
MNKRILKVDKNLRFRAMGSYTYSQIKKSGSKLLSEMGILIYPFVILVILPPASAPGAISSTPITSVLIGGNFTSVAVGF